MNEEHGFSCQAVPHVGRAMGLQPLRYVFSTVCGERSCGRMTSPVCLQKGTSAAKAVKRRFFMARLKPCPSFDCLIPSL
jgi:hypothetical protein